MSLESPQNGQEEIKVIEGKRYRKVPTGYTARQYYSHFTEGVGPGPGWDTFSRAPDEIAERYGVDVSGKKFFSFKPEDLPDEPHFTWREVIENK
jgi:hypothetical protein